MAKKESALKISDVMYAVDRRNYKWYENLTEEQEKAFSIWMVTRYASSVQGSNAKYYITEINERVNRYNKAEYLLPKHPELQWLLLSGCGSGKKEFHPYIKPPGNKKKKDKVAEWLSSYYPTMKSEELDLLLELNSESELKQLAIDSGLDDKQIKEIFGKK